MADVFGDVVLVGILVVAASGFVEDFQGKVGSRRSDFSSRYITVANINYGMVGIREVVQDDFAVFTKNGLEKVNKRYIALDGGVHALPRLIVSAIKIVSWQMNFNNILSNSGGSLFADV